MKLALLAPRNSAHTARWVNAFAGRGHDVHLISSHRGDLMLDERVRVHYLPVPAPLGYFANAPFLRGFLRAIRPEVLNVHYASGYGLLGRLSGFHPLCLNVWGSDVYEFPYRSAVHRRLIRSVLDHADRVASTSRAMAEQTSTLFESRHEIVVTPFGVDTDKFKPGSSKAAGGTITIGTAKTLAPIYGQAVLIEAFAQAKNMIALEDPALSSRLRLLIIGDGPSRTDLESQCDRLGIRADVTFTGNVEFQKIHQRMAEIDVFAALTLVNESFGVVAVEAASCGVPVVASDTPGFREVIDEGRTGFIVPRNDVPAAAAALKTLIQDESLRHRMGAEGRSWVKRRFEWSTCVDRLEALLVSMTAGGQA